jgi:hypothetical protein
MWVVKTDDDGIFAHCLICNTPEAIIGGFGRRFAMPQADWRSFYDTGPPIS